MMVERRRERAPATSAAIPGVEVGGKTGTAQSTPDRPPYAWFVSFAPADDPQVAVAVLVESSDTARDDIAGGRLAGPDRPVRDGGGDRQMSSTPESLRARYFEQARNWTP